MKSSSAKSTILIRVALQKKVISLRLKEIMLKEKNDVDIVL